MSGSNPPSGCPAVASGEADLASGEPDSASGQGQSGCSKSAVPKQPKGQWKRGQPRKKSRLPCISMEGKLYCMACPSLYQAKFISMDSYKKHYDRMHTEDNKVKCDKCNIEMLRNNFWKHKTKYCKK